MHNGIGDKCIVHNGIGTSTDENIGYGVIQLINPPDRAFSQGHVEVVETVAKILANSLANR